MLLKLDCIIIASLIIIPIIVKSQPDANDEDNVDFNYVIVFAEPDDPTVTGKPFFGYQSIRQLVQPCTKKYENDLPLDIRRHIKQCETPCNCERILKSSTVSLMSWAENAMGMNTACIKLHQTSNIPNDKMPRMKRRYHGRNKRSTHYIPLSEIANKDDFIKLPLTKNANHLGNNTKLLPVLKRVEDENEDGVPVYNVMPLKKKLKTNELKYYIPEVDTGLLQVKKVVSSSEKNRAKLCGTCGHGGVTTTEAAPTEELVLTEKVTSGAVINTETESMIEKVTEVSSSDGANTETTADDNTDDNIGDETTAFPTVATDRVELKPKLNKSKVADKQEQINDFWELLQMMSSIKSSFLNSVLQPSWGNQINNTASIKPSLLAMVKKMFQQLENLNNQKGFVAVIEGGAMSELNAEGSELRRALSFIKNNVDRTKTVIIVSSSCPTKEQRRLFEKPGSWLPVFVSGPTPNIYTFENIHELGDVPQTVKVNVENNVPRRSLAEEMMINQLYESFPNDQIFNERKLAEALVDSHYQDFDAEDERSNTVKKRSADSASNAPKNLLQRLLISFICFVIFWSVF